MYRKYLVYGCVLKCVRLKNKYTWNIIVSNDYVIDYRLRAAALTRASYFWRPIRLSRFATRRGPEMSVVGPVSSVPLARRLPEEMCARRRPERWLAGWLAWLRGVWISPNRPERRYPPRKSESSRGPVRWASERANARTSEKQRGSLSTRGEIDFERETWTPTA